MLEESGAEIGGCRLKKRIMFAGLQLSAFDEAHTVVQHSEIAGSIDVVHGCVWQPHAIIGNARAYALPQWRQPPMLNVAFGKLASRGAQQMLARDVRFHIDERHAVLQLIAKSVGAAGLIESGSRPNAAHQRLVEHPTIEHDVERTIRRRHLDRPQRFVPKLSDRFEHCIQIRCAITIEQGLRCGRGLGFTQEENDLRNFLRFQINRRLQCAARVKTRTGAFGKRRTSTQSGRLVQSSMSPQKFAAIAGPLRLPAIQIRKRHARAEGCVP